MDSKHKLGYVYLPKLRCYERVERERESLCLMIARLFHDIELKTLSAVFLENILECAFVQPAVSYTGSPEDPIRRDLMVYQNGVLDMSIPALIADPGPERFVVGHLAYPFKPGPTSC